MAERDSEKRLRTVLWVGPGRRCKEVGTVLTALATLDAEGERRNEPPARAELADLEELLGPRALEGLLILESGRVPAEDIGFVRRFLERHPAWRLVLIGDEAQPDPRARALLAAGRTRWLAWPPDLDVLRGLLGSGAPATPAKGARGGPRTRAGDERGDERGNEHGDGASVEIGGLVEELLASAALRKDGAPRFQFRAGAPIVLHRPRAVLLEGLGGLIELARACAGSDGLVRAAVDPGADGIVITLEFPRASLPEKDPGALLERTPAGLDPPLAAVLATARRAAAVLREAGARVELESADPARLRCLVRLTARAAPEPRPVRAGGKPDDPFA